MNEDCADFEPSCAVHKADDVEKCDDPQTTELKLSHHINNPFKLICAKIINEISTF